MDEKFYAVRFYYGADVVELREKSSEFADGEWFNDHSFYTKSSSEAANVARAYNLGAKRSQEAIVEKMTRFLKSP